MKETQVQTCSHPFRWEDLLRKDDIVLFDADFPPGLAFLVVEIYPLCRRPRKIFPRVIHFADHCLTHIRFLKATHKLPTLYDSFTTFSIPL